MGNGRCVPKSLVRSDILKLTLVRSDRSPRKIPTELRGRETDLYKGEQKENPDHGWREDGNEFADAVICEMNDRINRFSLFKYTDYSFDVRIYED